MYKAMIVDDERWVVQNMLDSVPWTRHGFEIAGTETHSPKALQQIQALNPDLVMVDIRMPEISGLELIKKCRELQLDTLFIVVSGLAEFSYAQKCMNLGAVGYCLKPVEEEEIIPLLKKTKQILDERSAKDVTSVIEWVMENSSQSRERIGKWLGQAGIQTKNGMRVVFGIEMENEELFPEYRHLKISSVGGKCMYIVEENNRLPLYEHLLLYSGKCKGIGLSRPFHQEANLKQAMDEAAMSAYQYFITGKPTVHQASGNNGFSAFRQLSSTLQKRDMAELAKLFDHYMQLFGTGNYSIKHAFFLYNTVMTTIIQSQHKETENLDHYWMIDYEGLIERYDDVQDLIRDLKRMTIAYLGGMYHEGKIRNEAFLAILEYVNTHYHKNLSLQMLADEYFMNRNYIGQLFVKHVSKSFTDYLAELRIRHACELLTNSSLPIQRVGERVGYPDAFYFSKIFKKIAGKTPSEYRAGR